MLLSPTRYTGKQKVRSTLPQNTNNNTNSNLITIIYINSNLCRQLGVGTRCSKPSSNTDFVSQQTHTTSDPHFGGRGVGVHQRISWTVIPHYKRHYLQILGPTLTCSLFNILALFEATSHKLSNRTTFFLFFFKSAKSNNKKQTKNNNNIHLKLPSGHVILRLQQKQPHFFPSHNRKGCISSGK